METKWTPGPWAIERGGDAGPDAIHSIGPCRANGYMNASWLSVSETDAHLIAAAPDLYAALEGILSAMLLSSNFIYDTLTRNASEAGYAALAKARGEA
jgi:hypothetical protein